MQAFGDCLKQVLRSSRCGAGAKISDYDRHSDYEPDIGWGGRLAIALVIVVFLLGSLGWLFV